MAKSRRPAMPDDLFNNGGAISKLTGGTPVGTRRESGPLPVPHHEEPEEGAVVEEQKSSAAQPQRKIRPTSFYLPPEQLGKLDELAYFHNKRTGQRINRNDIVRHLIAKCTLEDLMDLVEEKSR